MHEYKLKARLFIHSLSFARLDTRLTIDRVRTISSRETGETSVVIVIVDLFVSIVSNLNGRREKNMSHVIR